MKQRVVCPPALHAAYWKLLRIPARIRMHMLGAMHQWLTSLLQGSLQKHFLTGESREAWEQWTTQTVELKVVGASVVYLTL